MDFDFNLILVPATLFFIAVWLLDKFVLKQRATKGRGNENFIITWAYDFWPVLAVVMVLRWQRGDATTASAAAPTGL